MKLHHTLLAVAVLSLAATSANARTADITVSGSIVPPACNIQLSNGGVVNLGQVDLATLDQTNPTDLAIQNVTVGISCTAAAKVATSVTEDRPGTSYTVGNDYFGLNNTASGNPIGHYRVFAEDGLADTVAATVIGSANGTAWSSPVGGVPVEHGAGRKFTSLGSTATGPAAAMALQWTLRIEPTIAPANSLAITGSQAIDGQMTLTLAYL
jgi:type 1 fimbria pilin